MSIFKMNNPNKEVDDTPVIVRDFNRRAPFWSYRTAEYQELPEFAGFKSEIDAYLEKLFDGELDDGNGDVLDTMISDILRQAMRDLERQRVVHRDTIVSFGIRAKSDEAAFTNELQHQRDDLAQNLREQARICDRLHRDEFTDDFMEVENND